MRRLGIVLAAVVLALPAATRGGDWPQFRGPGGSARADDAKAPVEWSADKNVAWKAKVPGFAWSSPVVVGDKVFVTTAVSDKQVKPKGGFGPGGGGGFGPGGRGGRAPDEVYKFEVYCLNLADGKVVWKASAAEKKPGIASTMGNSYATETPVSDGERVYAYFGCAGLVCCFDTAGKLLWSKDVGAHRMMNGWGSGSSPVLAGDRLVLQCDNEEKSFLLALDKKTGEQAWKAERAEKSNWATPFVWTNAMRTEVVTSGRKVRSYDPATGKVLWELGGTEGGTANATPTADDALLFVGHGGGGGGMGGPGGPGGGGRNGAGPLYAVKAGAKGDVTPKSGETTSDGVAWSRPRSGPGMASPLVYQGHLYVLEQRGGMLSCYDAKTGKPAYEKQRLNGARGFTSSPVAADGKVYCLDEDGKTFVIKAGPEFKLIGTCPIGEMCWSSPALAGSSLLLRGVDNLYCIKP